MKVDVHATWRRNQTALGIEADGDPGGETAVAVANKLGVQPVYLDAPQPAPAPSAELFTSTRSEAIIATLDPRVQDAFRKLWHAADAHFSKQGLIFEFLSGTRTWDEQERLYEAHLAGGPQAAQPGHSFHQFRWAADAGLFRGKVYIDENPHAAAPSTMEKLYNEYGAIIPTIDTGDGGWLEWGGDFGDPPHAAYRPGWSKGMTETEALTRLRQKHDAGEVDYMKA
jgi:hypothetical protein